jgi:hypothetical protein
MHERLDLIKPEKGRNPHSWLKESDSFRKLIDKREQFKDIYQDPIDGCFYLAGFAPLDGPSGWGVVIQHDRDRALQRIGKLKRSLQLYALAGVFVAGALTAGLWGWLYWTLRRVERGTHA